MGVVRSAMVNMQIASGAASGTGKNKRGGTTQQVMVFDDSARTNFVTGFHKRKKARRKKAEKENEEKVKQERRAARMEKRKTFKDINDTAKDMMADLSGNSAEHLKQLSAEVNQTLEFESEDAVVTVTCEPMVAEEEKVVKTTDRSKSSDPAAMKKAIKKEKQAKRKNVDNQHHGKKMSKRK